MGNYLCCCCCCKGKKDQDEKQKTLDRTASPKEVFKTDDNEDHSEEKRLIDEEKLKEEAKKAYKAGESGYAKLKGKQSKLRAKSLSDSQYNKKGLVDENSKEFQTVKGFVGGRGYQLICSIGSGNYAEVYKAFGTKQHRHVAVKVIDLRKANENYRKNFLPREIIILRKCKHKNIIKMYEIAQAGNRIYMIMEFAPNGTLTDWLRDNGAFNEPMAKVMFKQILDAIHFMHSQRIAHRDLKLENILITANRNPKISDFSYAMEVNPKNPKSDTYCGSLPYFSPELLQRQAYDPLISDIWSLGICFYIMLNDGLPFKLGDDRVMLQKQLNRDWKFRVKVDNKLSEELKSMIRRMLDPDTHKRATSAQLINDPVLKTNGI